MKQKRDHLNHGYQGIVQINENLIIGKSLVLFARENFAPATLDRVP